MRPHWSIYIFITWVGVNILSSINDTFYLYLPVSKWISPIIVPGYFIIAFLLIYIQLKKDKQSRSDLTQ